MSLEFVDGFDSYTQGSEGSLRWDVNGPGNPVSGGRYGGSYCTSGNPTKTVQNAVTRTVGCAFRYNSSNQLIIQLRDGGTGQIDLRVDSSGHLTLMRNNGGTLLATSTFAMSFNTWYYLELQATINSTTGYCEGRANGVTWVTFTGNTQQSSNALTNQISFFTNGGWFDDIYSRNDSTFMGELSIVADLSNAEGDTLNWTPNSGTAHFSRVNEASQDADTSYNFDATVGNLDLYKFPSRTITAGNTIAAIAFDMIARKDDVGVRQIAEQCKSSGTVYTGTTQTMSGSYVNYQQIREVDPATSTAWGTAAIGASGAQFGVKTIA